MIALAATSTVIFLRIVILRDKNCKEATNIDVGCEYRKEGYAGQHLRCKEPEAEQTNKWAVASSYDSTVCHYKMGMHIP